jgi:hypothetical protein
VIIRAPRPINGSVISTDPLRAPIELPDIEIEHDTQQDQHNWLLCVTKPRASRVFQQLVHMFTFICWLM